MIVDANDFILGVMQLGPGLVVQVVGVGDDRIQTVIAAGQFDHDQDLILAGLRRAGGVDQKLGNE